MRSCLTALLVLASIAAPRGAALAQEKPWLFFDLGENSLITTQKDPGTGDITSAAWVRFQGPDGKLSDAHAYLSSLRQHGYSVGAIINIPQDWGDPEVQGGRAWLDETDPAKKADLARALTSAKCEVIRDYLDGHAPGDEPHQKRRWNDPSYPLLDFGSFTPGAVFVPFLERFRKPMDGKEADRDRLFLYRQALQLAAAHGAKAIYQATDASDVAAAAQAGMLVRRLRFSVIRVAQDKDYYLSEAELERLR